MQLPSCLSAADRQSLCTAEKECGRYRPIVDVETVGKRDIDDLKGFACPWKMKKRRGYYFEPKRQAGPPHNVEDASLLLAGPTKSSCRETPFDARQIIRVPVCLNELRLYAMRGRVGMEGQTSRREFEYVEDRVPTFGDDLDPAQRD